MFSVCSSSVCLYCHERCIILLYRRKMLFKPHIPLYYVMYVLCMCVCVCSQYTQHVSLVCFDVFCAMCCMRYKMKTVKLLLNSVRRILARKEIKCNPQKNWMEAKSICIHISQIYNTH